ncbi:hypothetical protein STVIR_2092 [Streptomyces viridochromogenes Tue57]|uniref:Uncharacterized protein n=2 Tax=Streptomyces viridochromogenes TaxID=1938 RepID=L8PKW8_STRVR|nr:hypothetical protein STVIR_2092 [Streptomyces viridochromogenes Tue57]
MSQPPFQPPPPPPSQPPQDSYNPYNQPAPPQQAPGFGPPPAGQPPMPAGQPPAPGQPPMHPGTAPAWGQPPMQQIQPMYAAPPFQTPFGQQPRSSGHPVGAAFLAFFVSVIVSMIYSGIILLTYKDLTLTAANTLYLGHALINGAIVGALVGAVGHRSHGAWSTGVVIAALGAFFGYTNAWPLIVAESQSPAAVWDLLGYDILLPAKAWWKDESAGGVDWFSPLGLVVAAAAAWGLAYLTGNKRGRV